MSEPITLVLTEAGLDALVNAQAGNTANIVIAQLGISDRAFTAAPTLTALPNEAKRIATVSGQSVSETVIHMTAQDSDADTYDVLGFGLFLHDGTLFATYSQATAIIRKTSIGAFLFSVDIAFADTDAGAIDFGDATFLYPPATETVKGVAEIATQDEVDAGTDDERIVTPLKLAAVIAALIGGFSSATENVEGVIELATQAEVDAEIDDTRAVTPLKLASRIAFVMAALAGESAARQNDDSALQALIDAEVVNRGDGDAALQALIDSLEAITITGSGLVTGGGNLTANRTLQVLAATGAEAIAEIINNKALTPLSLASFPRSAITNGYATIPGTGGLIIQHGRFMANGNSSPTVTWPIAFPNECYAAIANGSVTDFGAQDNAVAFRNETLTRFSGVAYNAATSHLASYIAIGR
ncbi:gp53-like domain-containing protein [Erythrobacter sp. EC-HK427]|uniref:gp53-like domain-containing protein n=1 Tax=Erythrobacter sp. EC-HK427 TaxID=2038396 RepID=UPI001251B2F5|nr:hypothetical protein [Erythrobacter sp. EC-HK427]VVT07389.1 conserved hypothetical protein [Erythrobacter sp. EC-HK427]